MASTRDALLEQGALLFARRGVDGVTTRELHAAVGARNESALHYHFGSRDGLVRAIVHGHLEAVERRRARLVARIESDGRQDDLRALVAALVLPPAEDLAEPLGRAHLRLVAQLSHPALAYEVPFQEVEAPAGTAVAGWLAQVLGPLPTPVRRERLALLRGQLVSLLALRAQLLDELHDDSPRLPSDEVFVQNLLDQVVAGLATEPSPATVHAVHDLGRPDPPPRT